MHNLAVSSIFVNTGGVSLKVAKHGLWGMQACDGVAGVAGVDVTRGSKALISITASSSDWGIDSTGDDCVGTGLGICGGVHTAETGEKAIVNLPVRGGVIIVGIGVKLNCDSGEVEGIEAGGDSIVDGMEVDSILVGPLSCP